MEIQTPVGNCHGEAPELLCDLRDHILMKMRGPPILSRMPGCWEVVGPGRPVRAEWLAAPLGKWPQWHPMDCEQVEMWISPWEA